VKGFHKFAPHHNWLACMAPGPCPTHALRGLEPYQSNGPHFSVFCSTPATAPEPWAKAKPMKNQDALSNSGLAVIVISDDLAVRNSLKFWLEIEGLAVRSYVSGADLLSAGDLARCDCYVVDQKTSATSALNLIAQLRDRRLTAPAILIASHPSLTLRQQAEKAEVPIVEKPLVGNALLDKIRDVIGARG